MKKIIIPVVGFLVIFLLSGCSNLPDEKETNKNEPEVPTSTPTSEKLKICPDEWVVNKMPTTGTKKNEQYFIIDGKRQEIENFDIDWIESNCKIEKEEVF